MVFFSVSKRLCVSLLLYISSRRTRRNRLDLQPRPTWCLLRERSRLRPGHGGGLIWRFHNLQHARRRFTLRNSVPQSAHARHCGRWDGACCEREPPPLRRWPWISLGDAGAPLSAHLSILWESVRRRRQRRRALQTVCTTLDILAILDTTRCCGGARPTRSSATSQSFARFVRRTTAIRGSDGLRRGSRTSPHGTRYSMCNSMSLKLHETARPWAGGDRRHHGTIDRPLLSSADADQPSPPVSRHRRAHARHHHLGWTTRCSTSSAPHAGAHGLFMFGYSSDLGRSGQMLRPVLHASCSGLLP